MSETLKQILNLIHNKETNISAHGYDALINDDIFVTDLIASIDEAEIIEDYPAYPKGACVLVLQKDGNDQPIHTVRGIPRTKLLLRY